MAAEDLLAKTTRINLLFDFYGPLLTEKQRTFLTCYFHDDLSLGEIAAEYEISRQAVYEHIKRAELTLEDYERKLALVAKHERRRDCLNELLERVEKPEAGVSDEVRRALRQLQELEA